MNRAAGAAGRRIRRCYREAAAARPGVLSKVGLDSFVDPRRLGGRVNDATTEEIARVVEFDGEEWLYFRAIQPNVAIVRGMAADERGNVSMKDEGACLGALAADIAVNAPIALQMAKQLIDTGAVLGRAVALESLASGLTASTADGQEGVAAFREKGAARFGGFESIADA